MGVAAQSAFRGGFGAPTWRARRCTSPAAERPVSWESSDTWALRNGAYGAAPLAIKALPSYNSKVIYFYNLSRHTTAKRRR